MNRDISNTLFFASCPADWAYTYPISPERADNLEKGERIIYVPLNEMRKGTIVQVTKEGKAPNPARSKYLIRLNGGLRATITGSQLINYFAVMDDG